MKSHILFAGVLLYFQCSLMATGLFNSPDNREGLTYPYTTDSLQAELYIEMGRRLIDSVEINSSMDYYNQALTLAEKLDNDLLRAKAWNGIGYLYSIYLSEFDTALVCLKKAHQLYEKTHQAELEARCLFDICDVLRSLGRRKASSEVLIEAGLINDSLGLDSINAGVYFKMAGVFFELKNRDKYKQYLNKAFNLAYKYNDRLVLAVSYMSMAREINLEGKLDSARIFANNALNLGRELKDPITIGYAYRTLAEIEFSIDNFDAAKRYSQKMLHVPKLPPMEVAQFSFFYGDFLCRYGKYLEAQEYLVFSLEEGKTMDAKVLQWQSLEKLLEVYEHLGAFEKAYFHAKSFQSLSEEIQNRELKREVEELDLKYETEKKEKEILALKARNIEQKLTLVETTATARQHYWWGVFATLFLIILGAGFWAYIRNSKQQQKIAERETALQAEKLIQLKQEQKNIALRAMLKGEEYERRRVAKELHDGVGILLSSLKIRLNQLKGTATTLTNANKLVDKASSELRRIAQNMKPEALMKFGLVAAVEDLCDEINFNKKLHITFQHFGLQILKQDDTALQVYRIIQELLNNIIKHAKATEALVQLIQQEEKLLITIEDNGRGFDPTKNRGNGQGLQNIESRVKYLNAKITWDSVIDQGTTVSIVVELNKQNDKVIAYR